MEKRLLPSIGTVTKKELLAVTERVDDRSTLIFETEHPYSGYYGTTVPDKDDPKSLFIVTRHHYIDDKVIRSVREIKKYYSFAFDAVPGSITNNNKVYGVIRIKCLSHVRILELSSAFRKNGIEIMSKQRISPFHGIIRLTKYFNTMEVEEGIYFDLDNQAFAYIEIGRHLRWNSFEGITQHVMNNVEGFTFDAALATMYDQTGVLDFVRVYDEARSEEKLRIVRNRYLELIAKL